MATAKENLNLGCRVTRPSDTNVLTILGDMLETMRAAFVELQAASQLSDFAAFKAAMDATAANLTLLADDGNYDLEEN